MLLAKENIGKRGPLVRSLKLIADISGVAKKEKKKKWEKT